MSQPTACIRCKGTEFADASFTGIGTLNISVDEAHKSTVAARVCLACGAILLTAAEPGSLRAGPSPERHVQESDF